MSRLMLLKRYSKAYQIPSGTTALFVLSLAYLLFLWLVGYLKMEQWIAIAAINVLFQMGKPTRKVVMGFAIFLIFGLLYDLLRVFPNYLYRTVDIAPIYNLEKQIFGIDFYGRRLIPAEFFAMHTCSLFDFLSGFFYLNWIPVPLLFATYLYATNRRNFLRFSMVFLLINLIGFAIYYIHPAAPPWYVAQNGFILNLQTPGSAAGLARFDALVQVPVFTSIYTKNSNVFAAIPSLHSAYPVVVLFYGLRFKLGSLNLFLALVMVGIWFAAVYSGHHYIIDVILGIVCAATGILVFERVLMNFHWFRRFFENYLAVIKSRDK